VRAFLIILMLIPSAWAIAQGAPDAGDDAAIRALIARWYGELQKPAGRKHWQLYAPGGIDGGPAETEIDPESRARSPTISNELAAKALTFAYDVDVLTIDVRFAKVIVWERGYFFAWAAQTTYEAAASALFILEKQADGRWLILAHEATPIGIPPTKITDPMPNLRALFYATQGKGRDPEADAEAGKKF
jgi:hypothetical protein